MIHFYNEQEYGYFAYVDDLGNLVIGERVPHRDVLWHGFYKGEDDTPYLDKIKVANPKLYKRIVDYFENGPMEDSDSLASIAQCSNYTDLEKLEKIFKRQRGSIYKNHIELYYVLASMFGG